MSISRLTSRQSGNSAFFSGEHRSPWYMVAFGMIGASISGVTFVSVPGMVLQQDMTYLQTCLGFILGYYAVAYILLPLYYRLRLTTIYTYLGKRLGHSSHLTGTIFFFISKLAGAAIRFYVVCMLLQRFVLDPYGIPFFITVPVLVLLIWLYTRRAGIKTLVWTDTLQTLFMFVAVIMITAAVIGRLDMSLTEAARAVMDNPMSRIFVFDDATSRQYFWKQFLSGVFRGCTTGMPLVMVIPNSDVHARDYDALRTVARPGHADFTARVKAKGFYDYRGGGHFSGRLTAPLTAAGSIAKTVLAAQGVTVSAHVVDEEDLRRRAAEAKAAGDSVGGQIFCRVDGLPAGIGGPDWFDAVESEIARHVFAIPAVKAVGFGAGEDFAGMRGSQANDPLRTDGRNVWTETNHNGGVNGGKCGKTCGFKCGLCRVSLNAESGHALKSIYQQAQGLTVFDNLHKGNSADSPTAGNGVFQFGALFGIPYSCGSLNVGRCDIANVLRGQQFGNGHGLDFGVFTDFNCVCVHGLFSFFIDC